MSVRVMVVEDDPMVMEIVSIYVESVDGFVMAGQASSGQQALDVLERDAIDLIVLDVHMPVMNGVEFLTILRSRGNPADVIFLTASNDMRVINNALRLGAVDYLIKPFTYERFKGALGNFTRRRRMLGDAGKATQEQLDRMFGQPAAGAEPVQKGLHHKTLESVRNYIESLGGTAFSQSEVARRLGLSKVTVRKYMEYLVSINELALDVEHGAIGRPTHIYRRIKP